MISEPTARTDVLSEPEPVRRSVADGASPAKRLGPWLRWGLLIALAGGVAAWFALPAAAPDERRGRGGPKATPVSVALIATGGLTAHTTYPGELTADSADVASLIAGRLLAVHVRLGDAVEAGQLIAELDTAELAEQRAEALAQQRAAAASRNRANVDLRLATRELERTDGLAERGIASGQERDARRAAVEGHRAGLRLAAAQEEQARARVAALEQRIAEARIVAPFDGVVSARSFDAGGFVPVGATIARVVARDPLRVRFEVPEHELAGLTLSAPVSVTASPTPEPRPARVIGAAGEVERERRVVAVEAEIDEPPPSWLPGMYVDVKVVRRALEDALIVPQIALVSRLGVSGEIDHGIFVVDGDVARWVDVVVVARDATRAAIAAEVAPDALVLVGGHGDLSDGAAIEIPGGEAREGARPPRASAVEGRR